MTTRIEATFYFDFADVSSYLAAVQLRSFVESCPVELALFPVDGAQLCGLSGEPALANAELGKRYLQKDAQRWAHQHGHRLVWSASPFSAGLSLRVAHWLVENEPACALDFVLNVFDLVWEQGRAPDGTALAECLADVGVSSRVPMKEAISSERFRAFEVRTEDAVSDGVFRVPSLRVGRELFVGHERFDFAAYEVLQQLARSAPRSAVDHAVAHLLLKAESPQRQRVVKELMDSGDSASRQKKEVGGAEPRFLAFAGLLRTLPSPDPEVLQIPISTPDGTIGLRVFPTPRANDALGGVGRLEELRENGREEQGRLFGPEPLVLPNEATLRRSLKASESSYAGLLGPALLEGAPGILHIADREDGGHVKASPEEAANLADVLAPFSIAGAGVAYLRGELRKDPNAHRQASASGAHVLILPEDVSRLTAIATAVRCERWVLRFGKDELLLFDKSGREQRIGRSTKPIDLELPWPPEHLGEAEPWVPPRARTTLVNEVPIVLGAPDSGADVGFTVTGTGLHVSTPNEKSFLSANRPFETIRLGAGLLLILPVCGNQIRGSEVVSQKLLTALSKGARDARLLLVSYWSELSYEDLVVLRPVLAATAQEQGLPVLLVIGTRVVELWQPDRGKTPFRVESVGDQFSIDVAQQQSIPERQRTFVERYGEGVERYLALLMNLIARA